MVEHQNAFGVRNSLLQVNSEHAHDRLASLAPIHTQVRENPRCTTL